MTVIVKEPFQKVLIYGFFHLSCGRDTVPIWPDSPKYTITDAMNFNHDMDQVPLPALELFRTTSGGQK